MPLTGNVHILHLVRVRHRGDPLRVHAVLDDQDAAPRRQTGGDGRLHSRRARPGQEDGHEIPTGGERPDELVPDALDQVVEFCLTMADVGLQQRLPHALGYIDGTGVQQDHATAPPMAAFRNRSVMAAGSIPTRPTSSASSETFTSRKLGPSSFNIVFASYTASSSSRTRSTCL